MVVSTMGARSLPTVRVLHGVHPGSANAGSEVPFPLFSSGMGKASL